jgi:hypothetical protein
VSRSRPSSPICYAHDLLLAPWRTRPSSVAARETAAAMLLEQRSPALVLNSENGNRIFLAQLQA